MEESIIKSAGALFIVLLMLVVGGFFSGTLLWLIYDHIHAFFPTAAENGIIAKELGWWDSVCISWLFSILIRSRSVSSKDK